MLKRSRTWLKSITAFAAFSVAAIAPLQSGSADQMSDAGAAGTSSGYNVLQILGSPSRMNQNISVPMTNPSASLRTFDKSQSFNASLATPSSNAFIQVTMQPSSTGDISQTIVLQDLDMDGSTDAAYTISRPISGVCANGYYSCTPGTWQDCKTYKWVSDNTGKITDTPSQLSELGGCYCINTSCGSNLVWNNSDVVLKSLGGGIVAAIQKANVGFTVTSVSISAIQISYYGRLVNASSTPASQTIPEYQALPPPVNAAAYYANPGAISNSVGSIVVNQSSDPSSIYYQLINSAASTQTSISTQKCVIGRAGQVTTSQSDYLGNGSGTMLSYGAIWLSNIVNSPGNFTINAEGVGPGFVPSTGWLKLTDLSIPQDTSTQIGGPLTKAEFQVTSMSGFMCTGGGGTISNLTVPVGMQMLSQWCSQPAMVTLNWRYAFERKMDTYSESVNDQCVGLSQDSTCTLQEEIIDGVYTVKNFNRTGLSPFSKCLDFPGQVSTNRICRDWWLKQRTYSCRSANKWDFTDLKRFEQVTGSLQRSNSTLYYNDMTKGSDGTWTTSSGSLTVPFQAQSSVCEKTCKTKVPINPGTDVTTTGVVSTLRIDPTSYNVLYKVCDNNGQCPVDKPGEFVVDQCQCSSNFADAAIALQVLRMAGKDTICSSGKPKPIH